MRQQHHVGFLLNKSTIFPDRVSLEVTSWVAVFVWAYFVVSSCVFFCAIFVLFSWLLTRLPCLHITF